MAQLSGARMSRAQFAKNHFDTHGEIVKRLHCKEFMCLIYLVLSMSTSPVKVFSMTKWLAMTGLAHYVTGLEPAMFRSEV